MKILIAALLATLTAMPSGATTVRVHYNNGADGTAGGAQIGVIGADGSALPAPAKIAGAAAGVHSFSWPDARGPLAIRATLAGQPSTGGAYRIAAGASADIYPFFGPASGKLTMMTVDAPQLPLHPARILRIYTPPSYGENLAKRYPVIYMHDGQNLFDPHTATYGTAWDIGQIADRLVGAGRMAEVIIVGIDNSAERIGEYTPCCDPK